MCDTDVDRQAVEVDGGGTDAFQTAQFLEVDFRTLFSSIDFVGGTHSSLDHAAGGAEDDGSASGFAERAVELFLGKFREVDVGLFNEGGQLAGGDGEIDIRIAVHLELVTTALVLLGEAGHHRDADHVFAFAVDLLGEVALCHGAEHLLRGLRGGGQFLQFRELVLEEIHPCRAAGGQDRQLDILVATEESLEAAEKLGTLFHDGQVSTPVGVEHIVEAEGLEGGGELAGHDGTGLHAEFLTESHTHGGSHLDNRLLAGIHDGADDLGGVVDFGKSTHRTNGDALAAERTG